MGIFDVFKQSKSEDLEGYVYLTSKDTHIPQEAKEGALLHVKGEGPPWIVVHHAALDVHPSSLSGQLWRVATIKLASAKNQPLAYANYTRALAVKILREESLAALFGNDGDTLVRIIKTVENLTRSQAEQLANYRHPEAKFAQDRVWRKWAKEQNINLEADGAYGFEHIRMVNDTKDQDETLDGTLDWNGSPVAGGGLNIVSNALRNRAQMLEGENAFIIDDEDETSLQDPWKSAGRVLSDAVLALCASEFISESDAAILLQAWNRFAGK